MDRFIGLKIVAAEPEVRDGVPGQKIVYEGDGYVSWTPDDDWFQVQE